MTYTHKHILIIMDYVIITYQNNTTAKKITFCFVTKFVLGIRVILYISKHL